MVEVIYVSPYDLSADILNYYFKILELGDITDYKDRLHFVFPENHEKFPSHFSTSRMLLYSPKTIARIKKLIQGKNAYIIPGYPSNDDVKLANELNLPIFW